ncbi:MAG TPA: zf-HC2 domain-containing protein [Gemmata sp.]|jgi:anti-sigma factor RsiW|nr:zf-HC2 domain-containing protein [Gemmata sp.]
MNCEELLELLIDYIGGELVVEKHQTVEIHLTGCTRCVTLVESYRHTIYFARTLPKCERLPTAVEERLRQLLAPHLEGVTKESEGRREEG